MHRQMQQEDPKNEILLAMLMTDKEKTGFIPVVELRAKLMNLGEKLTREEGKELLTEEGSIFSPAYYFGPVSPVVCSSLVLPLLWEAPLLATGRVTVIHSLSHLALPSANTDAAQCQARGTST